MLTGISGVLASYPTDIASICKRQRLLLMLELGQPASLTVGRHDLRRGRRDNATKTADDSRGGRRELRLKVRVDLNHIPRDLDSVLLPSARTTRPRLGRALVRESPDAGGLRAALVVHRDSDIDDGRELPAALPPLPITLVKLHLLDAGVRGLGRLARAEAERVAAVAASGPGLGWRLVTLRG